MKSYVYLLVDFFTVIVCLAASFHHKIRFHRHFFSFFKAALIASIPFIAWDIWFTNSGVWWFNTNYTIGWEILGLPLEEWLFFICIPFACVFTFFCLDKFFDLDWTSRYNKILPSLIAVTCLVVAILFYTRMYPFITALVTIITLFFLIYVAKVNWAGKATLVYLILLPGFFLVNGVLTGSGLQSPVVNYNPAEILNVRMVTIPVEDAVYGYTQFLLVLFLFKKFVKYEK